MSDADDLRQRLQNSLAMPGASVSKPAQAGVKLPGESDFRPLGNEQERIQTLNKFGEILRGPTIAPLHELAIILSVIAAASQNDTSIEARKSLRTVVANLYAFSERMR